MKLTGWLLMPFGLMLWAFPFSFAQPLFPARGFSEILSDTEAQAKVDAFKQVYFPTHKEKRHHQAFVYRVHFCHYPRSGPPTIYHGILSGPDSVTPVLRLDLFSSLQETSPYTSFLLHKKLVNSKVWKWENHQSKIINLPPEQWLLPLTEGINHSPFDLLMPFINWSFKYEKSGRVCGRPAHMFVFSPPSTSQWASSSLLAVRLAIDNSYDAPLRIEHMDGGILPAHVFSLQSFKKIGDRWVVKAIDAKNRDSRTRTRYELQAAAHGLDLPESLFQPSGLDQPINLASISFRSL